MKDSILVVPFFDDYFTLEYEHANKKQKVYDDSIRENESLVPLIRDKTNPEAFEFLKNCKCCVRHRIDKPDKFLIWSDPKFDALTENQFKHRPCKCDCRHLSRWLCRGESCAEF